MSKEAKAAHTAPWATATPSSRNPKRMLPQTVGHRGYKARFPENTMISFQGAVDAGAHAIETDLHLSKDGVVVLSHDATAKRCFGLNQKVNDCEWELLSTLRTLREPHEPMPKLMDLLEWMAKPENETIWVLLDIKNDDRAAKLVPSIAQVIAKAPAPIPWDQRIVLGCLNGNFVQNCRAFLPTYNIVLTSGSLPYANYFFTLPSVGFNILQKSLIGPPGWLFTRAVRHTQRLLYVWTVNDERWMRWCIRKNNVERSQSGKGHAEEYGVRLIDGVITDDPRLFREVCERWEEEEDGVRDREKVGVRIRLEGMVSATLWMVGAHVFCTWKMASRLFRAKIGSKPEI